MVSAASVMSGAWPMATAVDRTKVSLSMRQFRNLLVNIDIDIKKTCWILMDDAFLLPIKKVEQATIFLQLILKGCHDVLEFFLEFHIWEVGLGCLIICA